MQQQITNYFLWLQRENYKCFYLAFFRVAISCWLLKEVFINWSSMDILYGYECFVVSKNNFLNRLPNGDFLLVKAYYGWFIAVYIVVIFFNIAGIGRWFTALILFSMQLTLQKMNSSFVNGGDALAKLLLFYLIFANSYQYFVLFKQKKRSTASIKLQNLLSNLVAFSIMLQLCIAYFSSGLAKIMESVWWQGEATYYALQMERYIGTPFNRYLVQYRWFNFFSNYATLLFELFFPILIWVKKIRKPLLVAGLFFHACIYIFLMIYGFEIVFVLTYGFFLPNKSLLNFSEKVKLFFWKRKVVLTRSTF